MFRKEHAQTLESSKLSSLQGMQPSIFPVGSGSETKMRLAEERFHVLDGCLPTSVLLTQRATNRPKHSNLH